MQEHETRYEVTQDELRHLLQGIEEALEATREDGKTRRCYQGQIAVTIEQRSQSPRFHRIPDQQLTPRERQISNLVCQGYQNSEIARRTGIAESTVKRHLYNVFNKTGVDSRTQLVHVLGQLSA